jgi:hypothetical protein
MEPTAEGTPLAMWLANASATSQHDFRTLYDTLTPAHRSVLHHHHPSAGRAPSAPPPRPRLVEAAGFGLDAGEQAHQDGLQVGGQRRIESAYLLLEGRAEVRDADC